MFILAWNYPLSLSLFRYLPLTEHFSCFRYSDTWEHFLEYCQYSYLRNQQALKVHQYTGHQKLQQLEYTCDKKCTTIILHPIHRKIYLMRSCLFTLTIYFAQTCGIMTTQHLYINYTCKIIQHGKTGLNNSPPV